MSPYRLCIAPMMDRTDRHFRYLLRLLAPHARLYTEMITARALLHGDVDKLLRFAPAERPVALQLGGSDPAELAAAARIGEAAGYDEINLNVGCPSDRVRSGCFGAVLMLQPDLVAACVSAMREAVHVPVTVKTRLGVDDQDSYEFVQRFISRVAAAGCDTFILHARKAWLSGLSPKQNREIPPLDYGRVYALKREFPALRIVINGGLKTLDASLAQLEHVDGVMLGRIAYQDSSLLAEIDAGLHGSAPSLEATVLDSYMRHIVREVALGTPLKSMTRHLLGLRAGRPGGRRWRRELGLLDGIDSLLRLVSNPAGGEAESRELTLSFGSP
jgi:tRNA-dihydrouridine synthase A